MDVQFITTSRARIDSLPVVNGQLIYLFDENMSYYDMNNVRNPVSSVREVNGLPQTGYPEFLYVDTSTTPRNTYVWNSTTEEFERVGDHPTVLVDTLQAGDSSLTFEDSAITTNSTFDIYASVVGFYYTSSTVATGSLTLTFPVQSSDVSIKVIIT